MIKSHFPSARLERVKTTNMGTMYELSYRIEMRDVNQEKEFVDELRCRNGILFIVSGSAPCKGLK